MTYPPPYRDYLTPGSEPVRTEAAAARPDSVVIMQTREGHWHAVWQGSDRLLGEFDGTREAAIAWARPRSPRCWVYSEDLNDVVLLDGLGEPTS